jgi:hypothetical protein
MTRTTRHFNKPRQRWLHCRMDKGCSATAQLRALISQIQKLTPLQLGRVRSGHVKSDPGMTER